MYDKPAESPQPYRSYLNFIFKQATHGKLTPPHRFTQVLVLSSRTHTRTRTRTRSGPGVRVVQTWLLTALLLCFRGCVTTVCRGTQPIPPSYPMDTSLHRMMFDRLPWAEGLWEATPPDLLADLQAKL